MTNIAHLSFPYQQGELRKQQATADTHERRVNYILGLSDPGKIKKAIRLASGSVANDPRVAACLKALQDSTGNHAISDYIRKAISSCFGNTEMADVLADSLIKKILQETIPEFGCEADVESYVLQKISPSLRPSFLSNLKSIGSFINKAVQAMSYNPIYTAFSLMLLSASTIRAAYNNLTEAMLQETSRVRAHRIEYRANTLAENEVYSQKVRQVVQCVESKFSGKIPKTVETFIQIISECKQHSKISNPGTGQSASSKCSNTEEALFDYIKPREQKKPFGILSKLVEKYKKSDGNSLVEEKHNIFGVDLTLTTGGWVYKAYKSSARQETHELIAITVGIREKNGKNGGFYPLSVAGLHPYDEKFIVDRVAIMPCKQEDHRVSTFTGLFSLGSHKPYSLLRASTPIIRKKLSLLINKIIEGKFRNTKEFKTIFFAIKYLLASCFSYEKERGSQFTSVLIEQALIQYAKDNHGLSPNVEIPHLAPDGEFPAYLVFEGLTKFIEHCSGNENSHTEL